MNLEQTLTLERRYTLENEELEFQKRWDDLQQKRKDYYRIQKKVQELSEEDSEEDVDKKLLLAKVELEEALSKLNRSRKSFDECPKPKARKRSHENC